jgi:hypothetical protein
MRWTRKEWGEHSGMREREVIFVTVTFTVSHSRSAAEAGCSFSGSGLDSRGISLTRAPPSKFLPAAVQVSPVQGNPSSPVLRLILVMGYLYLSIDYVISVFFLFLGHQCFSSSL